MDRPVFPRLLQPMIALFVLLLTGGCVLLWWLYQSAALEESLRHTHRIVTMGGLASGLLMTTLLAYIAYVLRREDRRRREERAKHEESERLFLSVMHTSDDAIVLIDEHGFVDCNEATACALGYPSREAFIRTDRPITAPPTQPDGRNSAEKAREMERIAMEKGFHRFEWINRHADGHDFPADISITPVIFRGKRMIYCVWRDISRLKQAEAERERLQAQLAQAQKIESIGRLAGGVAHDFNNMLGVILGHVDLAFSRIAPDHPVHENLVEMQQAAEKSTALTRQLLAFARKQTIAPRPLDLNAAIDGMLGMLKRLLGESVDLVWRPGAEPGPVYMDPSQLDQILANLCVNARDAVSGTGKITVETGADVFDEAFCAEHAGFVAGTYAVLAVSDNGCGMDAEVMGHLFEPFFTTKVVGVGTGLGLPMVYGIVKQNGGFIKVYSEPGQGTTFKIYLPRHEGGTGVTPDDVVPITPTGHETILLVEDEPSILKLTQRLLEQLGYMVFPATAPEAAMRIARELPVAPDLLMTDVVLPEMNGRELAKRIREIHPGTRTLFTSGYTSNVIAHHGVLEQGVHFLHKPFRRHELAEAIRAVLSAGKT